MELLAYIVIGVVVFCVILWFYSKKNAVEDKRPWWEIAEDRLREKREEQEKKER